MMSGAGRHDFVPIMSLTGVFLDALGELYLAYDLLGGSLLLTRISYSRKKAKDPNPNHCLTTTVYIGKRSPEPNSDGSSLSSYHSTLSQLF
jgi:hypothetical protein